jgi:hypothetical protein
MSSFYFYKFVPRNIIELKNDDVSGQFEIWYNEELYGLYRAPTVGKLM